MKKIRIAVIALFATVAVCSTGYWVVRTVSIRAFASEDINVRPFVATDTEYMASTGRQKLVRTEVFARRRDGGTSKLAVYYNQDGSPKLKIRRVELPDGWVGMIVDTLHSKSTGQRPSTLVAGNKNALLNPPPHCLWNGDTADGTGKLFGQNALRVIKRVGPGELMRSVDWRLPDFNCVSVEGTLEQRADTSSDWQVISTKVLTSFTVADPDATMFAGWEDYQETNPTGIQRQLYGRSGATEEQCPECYAPDTKGDQVYAEWNKK